MDMPIATLLEMAHMNAAKLCISGGSAVNKLYGYVITYTGKTTGAKGVSSDVLATLEDAKTVKAGLQITSPNLKHVIYELHEVEA